MKKILLFVAVFSMQFTNAQTPSVNAIKTSATITIDGNLNEAAYQTFTNVAKTIVGIPNNTGTTFSVTWNSTYLYVGMRVTDGNLFNESTNAWDDDAFEIYIDADNNGGTTYGINDRQFMKEWNSTTIWEKANKTTGVLHAWAAITGGYTLEVAIPWSNIGITNPNAGLVIGFDIANDDDDNGAARESQRMWAGDNDNWRYPRNFGDLILQDIPDTQPPTAPVNLISANLTQTSVTLNWTASTDNVGVSGYDIYQNGIKINTSLITTTTFNVTGLTVATAYQFYVNARDAANNTSANSNILNVTTPDTQAPTAPTNLSSSNLTQTSVTLNWTASSDNVSVTGYDVYQNGLKINLSPVLGTTFNVTGLTAATAYQFYVNARDAAGNTSANSNVLNSTTLSIPDTEPPTAPSNLSASNLSQTSATLNWAASTDNVGVTGYDIYQNGIKINTSLVAVSFYNVTGLTVATAYQFYINAKDAAGNTSANSNILNITTPDTQAPTAPTNLSSSNLTQTSVTLNWTASTDNVSVTGYDVYQNGIKINPSPVLATSYNVTGLTAATAYQFYVNANDAAGNTSANSNIVNATTLLEPDIEAPTAPTNLSSSNLTQTSVNLNWTASSDNIAVTGYDIFQNGIKINTSPVTSTNYSATALLALTTYSYYVIARDAAGNLSAGSNIVTVTTPDTQVPTAPTGLTSSNLTATSVTLNWTASTDNVGVTGYDIYQNGIKLNTSLIISTTYNVTGLISATIYNFYVRALDGSGNVSANSNTVNLTTPDVIAPSAPSNLTASNLASTSVTLNWAAATDNVSVTGYDVYRNGVKINSSLVTTLTFNVTALTPSTVYQFYINASDAAGNISANSNVLNITTTAAPVSCTGTGSINFQRWNNITGTTVASLTSNVNYPNNPSTSGTLSLFEIPSNAADNYGMRVWGFICPPATGAYTFWIAADDNTELWLSTTSSSANRVRIAFHNGYTSSRQWNKYTTQKSAAITLNSGQLYFVEAIMKDGTGGDNMAVGWAKPGQSTTAPSEVIPGIQLRTSLPDTQAPVAATNLNAVNITQASFTLNWTAATDNIAVTGYDVFQNGIKVNPANITTTSFNVTGLTAATQYSYYVVARDAAGNLSANSSILNVTTTAPDTQAPTAPSNLASSNIGQTTFILTWSASTDNTGVTGYDVYRNGVKVNTSNIANTSFTVTGLTPGTTYNFTTKAKDAAGNESVFSNGLNVTTLLPNPGTETFTMRTILSNQRMPHDLVYGPDNNIWFIERFAGTVNFVNPVTRVETTVLTLGTAMVRTGGQDGLFGLAVHPQLLNGKPFVYIAYTYESTSLTLRKTRIVRYSYNSSTQQLETPVTILENIPGSNDHNSGRLAIGPDLKLYYTVGDMGAGQFDNISRINNAQDLNILEGKILRLNTEPEVGSWIPIDNPFTNLGLPTPVYTFGHRNPQGLVWGNVNGVNILYSTEHGPFSDDEVNIIENGRNYGWPNVIGFCDNNYNGRTTGGFTIINEQTNCTTLNAKEPIRSLFPVATPPAEGTNNSTWPSTAPSGTEFYGSSAIPGWQNSLLIAQLKRGAVTRFKLSNDGQNIISDTIHYFQGMGRFRDVMVSPDGLKIYVACDSSGSTSGPTGGVTSTPANPGSILEFTYQPPVGGRAFPQIITQTDVQENKKDKTIEIYPNPATSYFVIYNYKAEAGRTAELIDLNGRIIKRVLTNSIATRVDVKGMVNGLYIIRITDAAGKVMRVEKIVVQQ